MRTVVVHTCQDDIQAEQIRQILEQEGIFCQSASSIPHSVFPITMDGLGEIRISVLAGQADQARDLIKEFLAGPPVPPDEELPLQ